MNPATNATLKAYRPLSRTALRRELETARADLATATQLLNRVIAVTTLTWEATQIDEAPAYIPSYRERVA